MIRPRGCCGTSGELFAVSDAPLGKEVVLDPDDFAQGLDHCDSAGHGEDAVGEDRLGEDVLYHAEGGADVDVLDAEGLASS